MKYVIYKKCAVTEMPPNSQHNNSMNKSEICSTMQTLGAPMLREIQEFDIDSSTEFYYIIKDSHSSIEDLKPKVRNLVRRSLKNCTFRKIRYSDLLEDGFDVYKEAYESYNNTVLFHMPTKEEYTQNLLRHKNRDYWGAYDIESGKLLAYSINIPYSNGVVEYASMKCCPQSLKTHFPYYGLIQTMNEYYLTHNRCDYITDGARTLTEHSNIQEFLISKFGFRKAYCRMHMHYVWWLGLAINILYPFRNIIPSNTIKLLLKQEYWSRHS
ncbi:MAG: hypothetical protein JFR39_04460 [Muribaculaceae bacterium]|nr:hypothetical protein [Muribaculaceae bacterium]